MSIVVAFVVIVVITSYVYLWRNNITEKSWLKDSSITGYAREQHGAALTMRANKKVALIFFLAVVTSMFSLFISAYFMRMALADWQTLQDPDLLWLNTFILVLASSAIQWADYSSHHGQYRATKIALLTTGILTSAFIIGQLWVWRGLIDQGFYMTANPALAFFYLFTGLHGLHILGGLWVWCRTTLGVFFGTKLSSVIASIELCRTYWHFLLLVWLGLFGVLLST